MLNTKKVIFFIIIALVFLHMGLSLANVGSEITAERLLHDALDDYYAMPLVPDDSFLGDQTYIEDNLRRVITRFPESNSAKQAYLNLATLCLETENYEEAIGVADEMLDKYRLNTFISGEAILIKAVALEKDGNIDQALRELNVLREKYGKTKAGLKAPLLIANIYGRQERALQTKQAYDRAIVYYKRLEDENRGKMLGYLSSMYLVRAYMAINLYDAAGRVVEDVISRYPENVIPEQIPYVDLIFVKSLKNLDKATDIYELIMVRAKSTRLKSIARKKIQEIKRLKEIERVM